MQALQITFDQFSGTSKPPLPNEEELPSINKAVNLLTRNLEPAEEPSELLCGETTTSDPEYPIEETSRIEKQETTKPSISAETNDISSEAPTDENNDGLSAAEVPTTNALQEDLLLADNRDEANSRNTLFTRMQKQHDLIDGKTNEEAIQALIDHLDTAKEVKDTKNMAVMTLPPGLFVSFTISGSTFATSRENESDFVEKIKMALPKELRGAGNRLRTAIDRELEKYSIKVFNGIRYVPAKNFAKVQKLLVDAESNGIGKDQKYSVEKIREELWEHHDEINKNAEELGINSKIESMDDLKKKICLTSFFIDTTFGGTELDQALVDKVVEQKKQQVVGEAMIKLNNDIEVIVGNLSTQIANAKKTKDGKINTRSANAMQREIARVRSLNIVNDPDIDTLLNATEGLILRNKNPKALTSSTPTKQGRNRKKITAPNTSAPVEIPAPILANETDIIMAMPQSESLSNKQSQATTGENERAEKNVWIEELII